MLPNATKIVEDLADLIDARNELVGKDLSIVAKVANGVGLRSPADKEWTGDRLLPYWQSALTLAGFVHGKKPIYRAARDLVDIHWYEELDKRVLRKMLTIFRSKHPSVMVRRPYGGYSYYYNVRHLNMISRYMSNSDNYDEAEAEIAYDQMFRDRKFIKSEPKAPAPKIVEASDEEKKAFPLIDATYEGENLVFYEPADIKDFLFAILAENDALKKQNEAEKHRADHWRRQTAAVLLQMREGGIKPRVRVSNRVLGFSSPKESS